MEIKYAGPRPEISHKGIQFKEGKEDKYVYLIISLEILKAIDHAYVDDKLYHYDVETKRLNNKEMSDIMKKYEPELEQHIEEELEKFERHLNSEINHIRQRENLLPIEKETWVKNLEIMKEYRIQRAVNKIYYMHSIQHIKQIIFREKIKSIDTPFYEKFWHVLQTIQGRMSEGRTSMATNLEVSTNENGNLMAKLTMPNFY